MAISDDDTMKSVPSSIGLTATLPSTRFYDWEVHIEDAPSRQFCFTLVAIFGQFGEPDKVREVGTCRRELGDPSDTVLSGRSRLR